MTGFIPKEKLTAYQRWEVAAFDEAEQVARRESVPEINPPSHTLSEASPTSATPVLLPTAADIERMHDEAREQGYAAGHAEGIAAARAAAEQIDSLMNALQQSLKEVDQRIAEQLLATAVEIASQIMRQSLRIKPELLLPVVREAISTLHLHHAHPALFVHPDDAGLVRSQLGDQLAHANWRIIEDNTLTPGGCRVEQGASVVDATLETRWRRVIESIGISPEWLNDKP
jgi:flagellar assembly protein FliH